MLYCSANGRGSKMEFVDIRSFAEGLPGIQPVKAWDSSGKEAGDASGRVLAPRVFPSKCSVEMAEHTGKLNGLKSPGQAHSQTWRSWDCGLVPTGVGKACKCCFLILFLCQSVEMAEESWFRLGFRLNNNYCSFYCVRDGNGASAGLQRKTAMSLSKGQQGGWERETKWRCHRCNDSSTGQAELGLTPQRL